MTSLEIGEMTRLDAGDLIRLTAGDVVLEETRLDETGGSVRATILVRAPVERIWNVVSGCEYALRYLAGMEDCEIPVDLPSRAITRHVVDAGLLAPTLDYTFETRREPHKLMEIVLVEGNVKQIDGYWKFSPAHGGILVEHEIHVQPRVPAPRWIVRRKLRKDLPRMMLCIRGLSGGPGDNVTRVEDLAACPGSGPIND